ncbi:MAG: hypothetical protein NVSMB3_03010 [Acidobacteriaceae bacterium]
MTFHAFLQALGISGLRDLPIAYGAVALLQGGYFAWVVRGWHKRDDIR